MEFIWAGERQAVNQQKNFYIELKERVDRLEICAVDNYQVFVDGKFVAYGYLYLVLMVPSQAKHDHIDLYHQIDE